MVFGLFGSVAHELHFCVCAGYRLLICYGPLPMFFFTASKLQFRHRVEGLRTHRFGLPELGLYSGVWPFRIRCQRASFLCLCRLGCLSATVLYLCFVLRFRSCSFGTVWKGCERTVFGLPELGLLWCLAFSDPLPTSFIFVSVQVIGCLSATVLYLCFFLRLRSCSFGTVWKGCERIVFGLPELGL